MMRIAPFVAILLAALLAAPAAHADDHNPLPYTMFAFIAGNWSEQGGTETIAAAPYLGSNSLKFDVSGANSDGSTYNECWLAGFDPGTGTLYMDVYSSGGWRSVMDGHMIAPEKVWVFETPSAFAGALRERRVFTKVSNDEIDVKYEIADSGGAFGTPVEKKYSRVEGQPAQADQSSGDQGGTPIASGPAGE